MAKGPRVPTRWAYIRFGVGVAFEVAMLWLRSIGVEIETILILAPFTLMGWDAGDFLGMLTRGIGRDR